jgi:hypothetical protein
MVEHLSFEDVADRLIKWASEVDALRALWLEAPTLPELRRPYKGLEVHLSVDEPDYPGFLDALESELRTRLQARVVTVEETRRYARDLTVEAGARRFHLIAEQSHLLAKRPRAEVVPLVDKTGHLPHVLDYSLRQR